MAARKEEFDRKKAIKEALHSGYHDDTWGVNVKVLADLGYRYCGKGDIRYMALIDDNIDENGDKIDPFVNGKMSSKAFLFTGTKSRSFVIQPATGKKVMGLKIDPRFPGVNLYESRQIFKCPYVSLRRYYEEIPENERYRYRTKHTDYKNDYFRSKIKSKMIAQKKWCKNHGVAFDASPFINALAALDKDDIKNPRTGYCGFSDDYIFQYADICIDIDNHQGPCEWVQPMAERLCKLLLRGCDKNGELLKSATVDDILNVISEEDVEILPSSIVLTGRGLQLHFAIKPVPAKLRWKVELVCKRLVEIYEGVCAKYEPDLEVDRAASMRLGGYTRMPGSYNTKATGADGGYFLCTEKKSRIVKDEVSIEDMINALGLREQIRPKKETKKNVEDTSASTADEKEKTENASMEDTVKNGRAEVYENLRADRFFRLFEDMADGMEEGNRNTLLFYAGTVANEAGLNVTEYLQSLNARFAEKVPERELNRTAKSAASGKYHIKTTTILERIGFSDKNIEDIEKVREYGLSMNGAFIKNEKRHKLSVQRKAKRDLEISRLLKEGLSVSAIVRELGVCARTVRKVRDYAKEMTEKIKVRNLRIKESSDELIAAILKDWHDRTAALPESLYNRIVCIDGQTGEILET